MVGVNNDDNNAVRDNDTEVLKEYKRRDEEICAAVNKRPLTARKLRAKCEMLAKRLKETQNIETKKIISLEIHIMIHFGTMVPDTTFAFYTHQIIVRHYLKSPDCSHPKIIWLTTKEISVLQNFQIKDT